MPAERVLSNDSAGTSAPSPVTRIDPMGPTRFQNPMVCRPNGPHIGKILIARASLPRWESRRPICASPREVARASIGPTPEAFVRSGEAKRTGTVTVKDNDPLRCPFIPYRSVSFRESREAHQLCGAGKRVKSRRPGELKRGRGQKIKR